MMGIPILVLGFRLRGWDWDVRYDAFCVSRCSFELLGLGLGLAMAGFRLAILGV